MKSKIDPGLYFVLYDGVANYINNNEKSSPNNILENATEQQRKRQRDRTNTDLNSFSLLINEQQAIGWDNLLRGKLSVKWRTLQRGYELKQRYERNQRNVRLKLKLGQVSNPYDDDKAKKEKKKKKEKDIFQALIEKIFVICQEELWQQRNLDRHKPNNKRNYAAVIKTDREIRKQYGLFDEVCPNDIDLFFDVDLETRLAQTLSEKQKWIIRWKQAIKSSQKRAKRDALINTKSIWQYYNKSAKPKFKIRPEHTKRNKQHKAALKKERNAPLREITKGKGGFTVIGMTKSTSIHKTAPSKPKIFKIHTPSVTDYFSTKKNEDEPADRFGDAGND